MQPLSKEQRSAVETSSTRAGVIASAGTGKTRVITERVSYLLSEGVKPSSIIVFTFTNRAARELRERMRDTCKLGITIGTFHGVAYRSLPDPKPTVLRPNQADSILLKMSVGLGLGSKLGPARKFVASNPHCDLALTYFGYLKVNNLTDYTMLLMDYLARIDSSMGLEHVLVDEAQDTDGMQWSIVDAILDKCGASLFAVGDEKQQIYEWRGARSEDFMSRVKDVYQLTQTFRFGSQIAQLHNVLADRMGRGNQLLKSNVMTVSNEIDMQNSELSEIVDKLIRDEMYSPNDIAVLCRTNAQCESTMSLLVNSGFSVAVNEGYDSAAFDMLTYLCNPVGKPPLGVIPDGHPLESIKNAEPSAASAMVNHWLSTEFVSATVAAVLRTFTIDDYDMRRICGVVGDLPIRDGLAELTLGESEIDGATNGITVCTVHQAKGLEWPAVIALCGNRDGEEENRVSLVQATRSKERLVVVDRHKHQSPLAKAAFSILLGQGMRTALQDKIFNMMNNTQEAEDESEAMDGADI